MKILCVIAAVFFVASTVQAANPATMPATMPAAAPAKAVAPEYIPDPDYKPTRDLSHFFKKLRSGRPVTVMGIGGSVTDGHSWAPIATQWLQKQFPDKNIRYINGAAGGTSPTFCLFRLRRDHLPHRPDLVFVEYSVNCYPPKEDNWKALDGIIQQFLLQPQKPDFVFVYVGNDKHERGLDVIMPIGRHYGYPEVDPRAYLQKEYIDKGKLQWKDVSGDQIHPNRRGHEVYAEPVIELLKQQMDPALQPLPVLPKPAPFYSADWTTAAVLPIAAAQLDGPWEVVRGAHNCGYFVDDLLQCDVPGASLTVTANTTTFGFMCLMTGDSGKFKWSIDGGPEKESGLQLRRPGIWGRHVILAQNLKPGPHTLKITVIERPDPAKGGMIHIGGFCVSTPVPPGEPAPLSAGKE